MTDLDVEAALKAQRPLKVVATLDDDREVNIAIPRGTRRWERMAATLASQPWAEIRMYDKAGGLMCAPLVREAAAPRPAAGLEDISGGPAGRMIDQAVAERLMRATMDTAMRAFVEVAKVMRTSGSAEVTAALTANRETVSALSRFADDLRRQLADREATIADLEGELAAKLSEPPPAAVEAPKTATERLIDNFASGFFQGQEAGADKAKPAG